VEGNSRGQTEVLSRYFPRGADGNHEAQTDIIISNDSCHPGKHKISSINSIVNRLHTYPMTKEANKTEINTTKIHYTISNII
jgi:hypothetical protein